MDDAGPGPASTPSPSPAPASTPHEPAVEIKMVPDPARRSRTPDGDMRWADNRLAHARQGSRAPDDDPSWYAEVHDDEPADTILITLGHSPQRRPTMPASATPRRNMSAGSRGMTKPSMRARQRYSKSVVRRRDAGRRAATGTRATEPRQRCGIP